MNSEQIIISIDRYNSLLKAEEDLRELISKVASDENNLVLLQVVQVEFVSDRFYSRHWIPQYIIKNAGSDLKLIVNDRNIYHEKYLAMLDKDIPAAPFSWKTRKVKDL